MIYVLDASTLINLANGGVLSTVLSLPQTSFLISNVVRRESRSIAQAIDNAVASGRLGLIDDAVIPSQLFAQTKTRLNLDEGETECIVAADKLGCSMACDDGAARVRASRELGAARVIGSIRLLQMARHSGRLTAQSAYEAYQLMIKHGAFLPMVLDNHFA